MGGPSGVSVEDVWPVLQVVGAVDVALLLLPLFVLAGGSVRPGNAFVSQSCGWTPELLAQVCVLAVCALCFSLVLVAGELVALGATGGVCPHRKRALARRLLRDLPLPLLATASGGGLGASTLWGQAALNSGECSVPSQAGLVVAFMGAYLLVAYYAVLSSTGCLGPTGIMVPEDHPPLMHVGTLSVVPGEAGADEECNRGYRQDFQLPIGPPSHPHPSPRSDSAANNAAWGSQGSHHQQLNGLILGDGRQGKAAGVMEVPSIASVITRPGSPPNPILKSRSRELGNLAAASQVPGEEELLPGEVPQSMSRSGSEGSPKLYKQASVTFRDVTPEKSPSGGTEDGVTEDFVVHGNFSTQHLDTWSHQAAVEPAGDSSDATPKLRRQTTQEKMASASRRSSTQSSVWDGRNSERGSITSDDGKAAPEGAENTTAQASTAQDGSAAAQPCSDQPPAPPVPAPPPPPAPFQDGSGGAAKRGSDSSASAAKRGSQVGTRISYSELNQQQADQQASSGRRASATRRGSAGGGTTTTSVAGKRMSTGVTGQVGSPRTGAKDSKKEDRFETQFFGRRSQLVINQANPFDELEDDAGKLVTEEQSEALIALKRSVGAAAPLGEAEEVPQGAEEASTGETAETMKPSGSLGGKAECISRRSSFAASSPPPPEEEEEDLGELFEDGVSEGEKEDRPGSGGFSSEEAKPRTMSILVSAEKRSSASKSAIGQGRKSVSINLIAQEQATTGEVCEARVYEDPDIEKRGSALELLDIPVMHYAQSPINFCSLTSMKSINTSSDEDDDGAEEDEDGTGIDTFMGEQQTEVPVWLLDKERSAEELGGEIANLGDNSEDKGDTDDEDSEEGGDTVGALPDLSKSNAPGQQEQGSAKKRISFHDQVTGNPFDKWSAQKKDPIGSKKSVQLAVRSKSDTGVPSCGTNAFWKIPMPTRKHTMIPLADQKFGDAKACDDEDDIPAFPGRAPFQKISELAPTKIAAPEGMQAPKGAHPMGLAANVKRMSVKAKQAPKKGKDDFPFRRPSVLGVFSNDGAKAKGLYALPKLDEKGKDSKQGELVEVKRSSIVMSTGMLNDILKSKVDDDRFQAIQEDVQGDAQTITDQVVLPFFSAAKGAFRQCHCQTDPETGFVIHTCMTPAATMCDNTQNFASYVCSAWGSRRGSRGASRARSRRGSDQEAKSDDDDSGGEDDEDEDRPRDKGPTTLQAPGPSTGKRIRNASMLAIVGAAGPAPKKQDTDATISKDVSKDGEAKGPKKAKADGEDSSDEEKPEENDLQVSFRNIGGIAPDKDSPDVLSPEKRGSTGSAPGNEGAATPKALDQQVEADLGHRFDLVEPYQLAAWLKNKELREQILCVDVRGRDWVGGHIPLSINLHTSEVVRHPESLVMQCLRNRIHHLVFTCMYSVLRARKSALAVEQAQSEAQKAGLQTYRIRISLLAGGVHAWVNHYCRIAPQKSLVQDFDRECWIDGGPSQGGLVHVMDALWSSGGQKALSDALTAELALLMHTRGRDSREGSRRASAEGQVQEAKVKDPYT